ncbi:MAG: putative MFS family arabinose efflux permease [Hyphomicrobiaceae bacterium]
MARKASAIERLPIWAVILTCATITAIGMGIRQSMGLYMKPMSGHLGLGIEVFSMAIGIANIVWGLASPFTGAISDKYGSGRVVIFGALCTSAGLWLMYTADSAIHLYISGVFLGFGVAGAGINTLVGAVGRAAPPELRAAAVAKLGIGSGIGLLIALPYTHFLIGAIGWQASLAVLASTALIILPLAWPVSGKPPAADPDIKPQSLGAALSEALSHPSFWLLNAGFFVCGFHVVFYAVHLPSYVASQGIDASVGVIGLTVIGIGNLVGTYLAGQWGRKGSKKWGLTFIYLCRAALFLCFLYVPINGVTIIALSAALGLFWLSTVPLTSSLVSVFYGPTWMTMLYGIVFLSHQIGSFMGAWMAGYLFDRTQSYDTMWWISVALGLFAALIHIPIAERPVRRLLRRLTTRQDGFVRAYLGSGDARLAYLQVYGPDAMAQTDVDGEVNKLLSDPVVRKRILQLRDMNADRLQMTVERLTAMLIEDRTHAHQSGQYAAAVAATVGLAQLHGKIQATDGGIPLPDAEAASMEAELIEFTRRANRE